MYLELSLFSSRSSFRLNIISLSSQMKYILIMLQHLIHYNNENNDSGKKEEHKKENI